MHGRVPSLTYGVIVYLNVLSIADGRQRNHHEIHPLHIHIQEPIPVLDKAIRIRVIENDFCAIAHPKTPQDVDYQEELERGFGRRDCDVFRDDESAVPIGE